MNTLSFIIHTAVILYMKKIVTNLKKQQKEKREETNQFISFLKY